MNTSSITNEDAGKTTGEILLWLLQIATATVFLMAAYPRLSGTPAMVEMFEKIGLGQWFRYLTGTLEVLGSVLLLVPGLSGIGALVLMAVTTGAIVTHLTVLGGSPAHAAEYLALSAMVAWFRRNQIFRR